MPFTSPQTQAGGVLKTSVSAKKREFREAQPLAARVRLHALPTIPCGMSQTVLLQAASASPRAGCWQAGSPVIWRNLLVSMVTVTHWYGRS